MEEVTGKKIGENFGKSYPSSNLLLNISIDEYAKERERANSFDSRSCIFITVIMAIITLLMQTLPLKEIKNLIKNLDILVISIIVLSAFWVLAAIVLLLAFIYFIKVICTKKYKSVNIENLNDEEKNMAPADIMEYALVEHYNTILIENNKVNLNKSKNYDKGVFLTVISFVIILLITMILNILV